MHSPTYAILLDGGFVTKKLKERHGHQPTADEVVLECERIKAHPALSDCKLLRIYFYDAPPATQRLTNPIDKSVVDLGNTPIHSHQSSLLDTLELKPDFALRLGETVVHGWGIGQRALRDLQRKPRQIEARDLVPNVSQKGVDLRIGLDIARLALREQAQAIVVVTGDSDLVPAFKFARREGVRMYLDHMGHGVRRDLKAHVDIVL